MNSYLTVKKILEITNGILYCGDENTVLQTYCKDTRILNKDDVYIGIKGENFDGNTLYNEAFDKGASACILLNSTTIDKKYDKPIILVKDTILALKQIASYIRDNSSALFIAVTGSVGKTSTRDIIYSVISQKYKALKTEGNYNNNIGLPLTIMKLTDEQAAVIEMGMDKSGEIDYLTRITKPHIGVITNVGTAHIGNLGSRENILKAKMEIRNGINENGTLVINNDNDLLHDYYKKNSKGIMTIGIDNESDIMAKNIKINVDNATFQITYKENVYDCVLLVPSVSYIYNALEAFAVGILSNIEIDKIIEGIKSFKLTENRLETTTNKKGITIINDSYNASYDSMKSSLQILRNSKGKRKIAVLGDMLELGDFAKELHEKTGICAKENNIDILLTVGENAKYICSGAEKSGMSKNNIYHFDNNITAINELKKILEPDDIVLVKASHGLKFIEIVDALKNLE